MLCFVRKMTDTGLGSKIQSRLNYPIYGIFSNKIVEIIESFSAPSRNPEENPPVVAH